MVFIFRRFSHEPIIIRSMNWFDSRIRWHWTRKVDTQVSIPTIIIKTISKQNPDECQRHNHHIIVPNRRRYLNTSGKWVNGVNAIDCVTEKRSEWPLVYKIQMEEKYCQANADHRNPMTNIARAILNVISRMCFGNLMMPRIRLLVQFNFKFYFLAGKLHAPNAQRNAEKVFNKLRINAFKHSHISTTRKSSTIHSVRPLPIRNYSKNVWDHVCRPHGLTKNGER